MYQFEGAVDCECEAPATPARGNNNRDRQRANFCGQLIMAIKASGGERRTIVAISMPYAGSRPYAILCLHVFDRQPVLGTVGRL